MESIGRIELLAGSSDLLARDGNEASAASTVIRPGKKAPKRPVNDRHQLLIRYPRAIDTATFAHPAPPPNFLYFFFLLLILSFSILFVFDPHRHVFQSAACRARSYQQRLIGCYLSSGYRISWSLFFGFAAPSSGREFAAATSVTVDLGTRRLGNRFTEWLGVWGGAGGLPDFTDTHGVEFCLCGFSPTHGS